MINWIEYLEIDNKYTGEEAQKNILKFIFPYICCFLSADDSCKSEII